MIKLWGRTTSANVQKAMWALAEAGVAHERVDVGGAFGGLDTPEFTAMNPTRLIPVLQDGDLVLWESEAIVRYVAATSARGSLCPADPKQAAVADQWMMYSATSLQPEIIGVCFTQLVRVPAKDRNTAAIAAAAQKAGDKLGVLDRQLAGRPFLLGDALTMADISAGTLMYRYFALPISRPALPNVERWYASLSQRAAYRSSAMTDYAALQVA
ncbi:MAG: glutathione S-transferase N-terminal domain-containing protein [Hyphomicrobiaceae bacterium]|nr:glutathione S-transferase N-terminal domain-containing protein [Hyphomicrobiaceae bacterium]